MSGSGTRSLVRELLADGTVDAKDRAVSLLVRDGGGEADAQRSVWGIAPDDVAIARVEPYRATVWHLLKRRHRTLCGRGVSALSDVCWKDGAEVFGPLMKTCRSCKGTLTASYRYTSLHSIQAKALGVEPYDCRRGEHYVAPESPPGTCWWCGHTPLPLFGRA